MIQELKYFLKMEAPIFYVEIVSVGEAETADLLAHVKRLPEGTEMIVSVAFNCGQEKPQAGDIGLVVLAGNDADYAVMIAYVASTARPIHSRVEAGGLVSASRAGKKNHIISDTKVTIGKGGGTEEAEPLVLGTVLTSYLTALVTDIGSILTNTNIIATQLSTLGGVVAGIGGANGVVTALATLIVPTTGVLDTLKTKIATTDKGTYLTTTATNIKSQIAFTERGA